MPVDLCLHCRNSACVLCVVFPTGSPRVRLIWRVYKPLGESFFFFFFEDVPLVELMYLVFTRMPGGVTVGDRLSVVVSLVC